MTEEKKECLRAYGDSENCRGEVTTRRSAGGTCDIDECGFHMEQSMERQRGINERYPDSDMPPSWFDPTIAGEQWNSDY